MTPKDPTEKLEDRIEYLEENRRYIQNALETVLSLGDFQTTAESAPDGLDDLFAQAANKINRIIPFTSCTFYLVDEDSFLFAPEFCSVPHLLDDIEKEVDFMIDQGFFAWAVREKRGVLISSRDHSGQFLLHVISSDSRIRGMFVGQLPEEKHAIADTALTLLSIILMRVANALENREYYNFLQNQKEMLEKQVDIRTEALTRSERQLKAAMNRATDLAQKAEQASEAKSDFLAKMSHELRTPLNGIIGMAEIALSTEMDDRQRQMLQIIDRESSGLLRIINDILDFSKVEAGKMEIEIRPFDLRTLLDEVADTIAPQAQRKGLKLDTVLPANIPTRLKGDAMRIKQVLLNLAGNALKFTEKGEILISGTLVKKTDQEARIEFSVKDTGIGIPLDKQAAIFEGFTQADESTTRNYGGTGLGITISKQLVELMGGRLSLSSQEKTGTTFSYILDFDRHRDGTDQVPTTTGLNWKVGTVTAVKRGARILLVEDYPTNQQVAYTHLSAAGYRVDIAENGQQAVAIFQERPYDLILMDIQMPIMDGYAATGTIRELESQSTSSSEDLADQRRTPIIAMTAHALNGYKEKCLAAGMNDFITKPIKREPLLKTVDQWMHNGYETVAPREITVTDAPQPDESSAVPMAFETAVEEFGDKSLVLEVALELVSRVDRQLKVMHEALIKSDAGRINREAHAIKGGAWTIEAHLLGDLAERIEHLSKDQKLEPIGPLLDRLGEEHARLEGFLIKQK